MKYSLSILNDSLIIADEQNVIISNITIRINYVRSKNIAYFPSFIETNDNCTTVTFERTKERSWIVEATHVKLIFKERKLNVLED